jgi:hypothetical protein
VLVSVLLFVGKFNGKVSKDAGMLAASLLFATSRVQFRFFSIEAVWVSSPDVRALTAPIGSPLCKDFVSSFFAVFASFSISQRSLIVA